MVTVYPSQFATRRTLFHVLVGCGLLMRNVSRLKLPFFFSSRRRYTRSLCDWSSDVCSSDLVYQLRRQPPPFAFTQFCWTRKSLPPTCMFAVEPLEVVYVAPKSQAHLSAFSLPALSYHALRSSSVFVSSVSCARVFTSASAAGSLLGDPFRALQSKKSMSWGIAAYFTSFPFQEKLPWYAQYTMPKPPPRFTRASLNTRYSVFGSYVRLPLVNPATTWS